MTSALCELGPVSPGDVRRWQLAALDVDGAELLQGSLVSRGQAGVGQGRVPPPPAAAAGPRRAAVAGH